MWERIFSQWPDLLMLGFVSVVAGLMESVIMAEKRKPRYWLILFTVSMPVAVIAGGIAMESGIPDFITLAITAATAVLARDGLQAFLENKGAVILFVKDTIKNFITNRSNR